MTNPPKANLLGRENTFTKQAEAALRAMILSGAIAPNERVNEAALATDLGISRGPVREAMQRLSKSGLLTVVSHRGAFVRTFSRREVTDLYGVRAALEVRAVRLVAQRAPENDLVELRDLLMQTDDRAAAENDMRHHIELDFHLRVVQLAGNATLTSTYTGINHQLSLARSMSARLAERVPTVVSDHLELIETLRAREVDRAVELMDRHLDHACDGALDALGVRTTPQDGSADG